MLYNSYVSDSHKVSDNVMIFNYKYKQINHKPTWWIQFDWLKVVIFNLLGLSSHLFLYSVV